MTLSFDILSKIIPGQTRIGQSLNLLSALPIPCVANEIWSGVVRFLSY